MNKLEALASTMGENYEGPKAFRDEYGYQLGHTGPETIFCTGRRYWAIQKRQPKFEASHEWRKHPDQFWAEKVGLTVWVSGY